MPSQSLDIILPSYNPVKGWEDNIISAQQELALLLPEISVHLIIVNDGSSINIDDAVINKIHTSLQNAAVVWKFTFINNNVNKGKGFALREGVKRAEGKICIYTDIDFPYTTASFIKIWQQLNDGKTDIAAGIKDENYYRHVPAARRFISRVLRKSTALALRLKVADTQCGLKGFNANGKELFMQTTIDRYLFDLEFIFLASKKNALTIQPVTIELKENIKFSSMRFSVILDEGINFMKIFFKSL